MKSWIACLLVLLVVALVVSGAPAANKTRFVRQLGYGNQFGGLQSQLSGISSGYGYGYNNAVGLGGMGQGAAGAGYLPLMG